MPEGSPVPGSRPSRWLWLGRFLPHDVRERVFEPAFADLTHTWLTTARAERRVPFGLYALGTWVGCVPIALPRLFVRDGRLTRTGRAVVWGGTAVVLLIVVLANLQGSYSVYEP